MTVYQPFDLEVDLALLSAAANQQREFRRRLHCDWSIITYNSEKRRLIFFRVSNPHFYGISTDSSKILYVSKVRRGSSRAALRANFKGASISRDEFEIS